MKIITQKYFFVLIVSLFIFLVYLYSLCPTLYLIDSGELAAVSYSLGVAHPTGYPLYTLISYFVSRLPGSPIYNLNLLSAFFSAAAAFILLCHFAAGRKPGAGRADEYALWALPVSLFAFAPTVWRTSVTNEVYPLTGFFCILILFLLQRLKSDRDLFLLAYVTGLSLTNHMIAFTIALPVAVYVIAVRRPGFRRTLAAAAFFCAGLTLYLYLLARTRGGAELAWGDPFNLERLIWHVTGKQYRVWMFSSDLAEIGRNLGRGIGLLARDLLYIFIIPALVGFWRMLREDRPAGILFLAIPVLNILYAVNYSIPDIESYYLPGFAALVFAAGLGLRTLRLGRSWPVALLAILAVPIINYRACTLRRITFGRDYGLAHIEQLPANALLISTYWDIHSPVMYLTKVEGLRPDLVVIDKELLRRTWYLRHLEQAYPDFMARSRPQKDRYLRELVKFEYGRPYEAAAIQDAFIDLLAGFINAKLPDGAFLASPVPDRDLDQARPDCRRVPFGPDLQVSPEGTRGPRFDFTRLQLAKPAVTHDPRMEFNLKAFRSLIRNNAAYLRAQGQDSAAQAAEEWLRNHQ